MKKLYVASITPFDQNDHIDEDALKKIWDKNLSEGADGFFIGGSAGECFLMTSEERIKSFELASSYLTNTEIYAHVGSIYTSEAIIYAREAKNLGINKIAATPPFYFAFSEKEIAQYYYDIAEAANSPITYYNIPSSTHQELNIDHPDIQALLKSGAISAIKHTSLNLYQMERIKNINNTIQIYGGYENCMVAFLAFGCDGFIGSTFNFMLPQYRQIMKLYLANQHDEALNLQRKSNTILDLTIKSGLVASIKYILTERGISCGNPRRPMLPLDQAAKQKLLQTLNENLIVS